MPTTGTNAGVFARVKPHPDSLVLYSTDNDGVRKGPFTIGASAGWLHTLLALRHTHLSLRSDDCEGAPRGRSRGRLLELCVSSASAVYAAPSYSSACLPPPPIADAAGVAYSVLTDYRVGGLVIDNYRTSLPLKKGLSSSAAFCVCVLPALPLRPSRTRMTCHPPQACRAGVQPGLRPQDDRARGDEHGVPRRGACVSL